MTVFAGVASATDLSRYRWAVIGDSLSDPDWVCDCGCGVGKFDHYYHFVAGNTGIQVVYTNAVGSTGYMKEINQTYGKCFYRRLLENPLPRDVDVVTILGSVNDGINAPDLTSAGRVSDELPGKENVAAYINKTIDVIREQAPNAKIVLVTGLHFKGTAQEKYRRCMDVLGKVADYRCVEFHDWLTPNPDDPLDFVNITNSAFARDYAVDWKKSGAFGHPNERYNSDWLAPKFESVLVKALTDPDPIDPPSVNLSRYRWAVVGDKYSVSENRPWPKYVDFVSEKTGIHIPYENAANSDKIGYWADNSGKDMPFYRRIQENPVPSDVDLITLYGTVFDHNFDSTRYDTDPDNDIYPGNPGDRLPTKTYAAYVNAALDALVGQAPKAKIVMVGPLYHSGISTEKLNGINDTLAAVAEYRGIEFHDWLNGQSGDPLDYHRITTDLDFFEEFVYDRTGRTMGSGNWYGEPTASYHAQWIGPRMLSIVSNALVGTGAPAVAPELSSVRVIPWGSSAVFYGSFAKIGSGARSGDVYLAYGESPERLCEPIKVLEGRTGSFEYELKGIAKNTRYFFSLTAVNDARTPMTSAAVTGSFTTIEEDRKDWSSKKWAVIGDSISDPVHPSAKDPVTKYYHFVARDTGIRVVYTNAFGSTGYEHQNGNGIKGFYIRLKDESKWRIPADVDVVTIFGSVNDCDKYNHIGSASDRFEDGKSSYSAYVNGTVDLVRKYAPDARIILVSGIYYHLPEGKAEKFRKVTDAVRAVAEFRHVTFCDWLTEDPDDPLDFHRIADDPLAEGSFARRYAIDPDNLNTIGEFGHPNDLYNEIWLSPHFRSILATAFADDFAIGEPTARPSTNFNGSVVSFAFAGEIPDGSEASAMLSLEGVDYVGEIRNGSVVFTIPAETVTAGNRYGGVITLTVDGNVYVKPVDLVQGRIAVDEDADWIREGAATFGTTGAWSGGLAIVEDEAIAVSDAVFTAARPSPENSVVTVATVVAFGGVDDHPFDDTALAGVKVVGVGDTRRYAMLTGVGVKTNFSAVANLGSMVAVTVRVDFAEKTLDYGIGDGVFGPFPLKSGASCVSDVCFAGRATVVSLEGAYRAEGVDTNLAAVGGTGYATVEEAVSAAGSDGVRLLWDATWTPSEKGEYRVSTNGFTLAIGGGLAWSVKDNGDGTVTVSVTDGADPSAPSPTSITIVGGKVRIGVRDVSADCRYALEKTFDLADGFTVVDKTWTSGADLLAGTSELVVDFGPDESQAFYRVVVSASERH